MNPSQRLYRQIRSLRPSGGLPMNANKKVLSSFPSGLSYSLSATENESFLPFGQQCGSVTYWPSALDGG